MAEIVPLPGDQHREAQLLLPWYATGRLEAADAERIAAHVAACARCQADLRMERRLEAEVAGLPLDVEEGWRSLLGRVQAEPTGRSAGVGPMLRSFTGRTGRWLKFGTPWLGWAAAAGVGAVLIAGPAMRPPPPPPAPYHGLAAPRQPQGNLIVVFRPETSERAISRLLRSVDARLTDGPTAADAYVLLAPAARRDRALAALRGRKEIVLAEPLDAGGPP